jgi:hypothetical protein
MSSLALKTYGRQMWVLCQCGRVFEGYTVEECADAEAALEHHECFWVIESLDLRCHGCHRAMPGISQFKPPMNLHIRAWDGTRHVVVCSYDCIARVESNA